MVDDARHAWLGHGHPLADAVTLPQPERSGQRLGDRHGVQAGAVRRSDDVLALAQGQNFRAAGALFELHVAKDCADASTSRIDLERRSEGECHPQGRDRVVGHAAPLGAILAGRPAGFLIDALALARADIGEPERAEPF